MTQDGTQVPAQAPARIPAREQRLDPRAIARASQDAARNASLWWVCGGVLLAVVVALLAGTAAGSWVLAGVLLAGAVARVLLPKPGPVAVAVRSKTFDATVLVVLAVGISVLAAILPTGPI
ncbi:hypothetical protein CCO02nite_12030 [Cellulomonas composti]|uniref:DUF3017 domain-containing protein n=2 Tax=Cellulomonas composti TaxID=266130 RepID=A0A511J980_9CELL|nr:hypothetical protein CCO02nite_12030 [Cellulomonas composti]